MNWKKIAAMCLDKGLGFVGHALGGDLGEDVAQGIGGQIASLLGVEAEPEIVASALEAHPEIFAQIKGIDANLKIRMAEIASSDLQAEIAAAVAGQAAIGKTIDTEIKELRHPLAGFWRPYLGIVYSTAFGLIVLEFLLFGIIAAWKGHLETFFIHLPAALGAAGILLGVPMPILGVAAHHRGAMQRIQAGEVKTPGLLASLTTKLLTK